MIIRKASIGNLFSVSGNGELSLDHVTLDSDGNFIGALIDANDGSRVNICADAKLENNVDTAVEISGTAEVTLKGKIENCKTSATVSGGAFFMNGGKLIMEADSSINHCEAKHGAAVRMDPSISSRCEFVMNGGTIENNTAYDNGSAVSAKNNSIFTMNGGEIKNNVNGKTDMSLSDAEKMSAVQVLYGATFTINDGTIAGNTTTGANECQIYALYNGIVNINGGTVRDNIDNGSGSIFVNGSSRDKDKCASISIDSCYLGTTIVRDISADDGMVQTIVNGNPVDDVGSISLVYPKAIGSNGAKISAGVKDVNHYLNYVYDPTVGDDIILDGSSLRGFDYGANILNTTAAGTLSLHWGTFHMVQFDINGFEESFAVFKNDISAQLDSGDYVASCDRIIVTTGVETSFCSVHMNDSEYNLETNDGSRVATMVVPSGMEILHIVLDVGKLSVTVCGTMEIMYGSTPSDLTVTIDNGSSEDIIVTSRTATERFGFADSSDIMAISADEGVTVTWGLTPPSDLDVGGYGVEIKLYDGSHIIGYAYFVYVVTGGICVEVYYGDDKIDNGGTILYTIGVDALMFDVRANAPMVFVGFDTVFPTSVETRFEDDEDDEKKNMTVTFGPIGNATGCFYMNLFVCGESGSAESSFFINIVPKAEVLTEPLI